MSVEGQPDKITSDMEVHVVQMCVTKFLHTGKKKKNCMQKKLHWHSSVLAEHWRPNSGYEHREAVGGTSQE